MSSQPINNWLALKRRQNYEEYDVEERLDALLKENKNTSKDCFRWELDGRIVWKCPHEIPHTVSVRPGVEDKDYEWIHNCDGCCRFVRSHKKLVKNTVWTGMSA